MRLLFSAFLALALLASCAELSKLKVGSDGMYRFKQQPVAVWAPKECLLDMAVFESSNSVDFVTGRGYWQAGGQYAVQVYPISKEIKDATSFIAETKKFLPQYMVKDRASKGFDFKLRSEKQLEVNGRPAYQAIATEEGKAVFIATFVLHTSRITVASLIFPVKIGELPETKIPWKCYEKFSTSVTETPRQ